MSVIADDIRISLSGKEILHGVDFSAVAGELTAIVGPNGSGKTTLLRALTTDIGYRGRIRVNGVDIARADIAALARMRAVLPQASSLSFPFTVAEIVRIGLEAQGHRDDNLIRQALQLVDLPGFSGRLYQKLSGGEQQRVQLARVLCQVWQPVGPEGPRWLFLDEPVSSLDIGHQLTIMRLARDYARRGGGVIAVMHDLNLTAMFADRLCMMKQGAILAEGRPQTVLTDETLTAAYGCALRVNVVPQAGPWLLPQGAGA